MSKCTCGYEKFFYKFSDRLHTALVPAVKMWQKDNNKPHTWPDTVSLVRWLVKKAKESTK